MVGHERRDEIIAVVVPRLAPERQWDSGRRACSFEEFGPQLFFDERVRIADVDKQLGQPRAVLDQGDGVMLVPCIAVAAEITGQRLLPPRHLARCDDRGEGRHAAKAVREIAARPSARHARPSNGR